jgi:hypothetical protein
MLTQHISALCKVGKRRWKMLEENQEAESFPIQFSQQTLKVITGVNFEFQER